MVVQGYNKTVENFVTRFHVQYDSVMYGGISTILDVTGADRVSNTISQYILLLVTCVIQQALTNVFIKHNQFTRPIKTHNLQY